MFVSRVLLPARVEASVPAAGVAASVVQVASAAVEAAVELVGEDSVPREEALSVVVSAPEVEAAVEL